MTDRSESTNFGSVIVTSDVNSVVCGMSGALLAPLIASKMGPVVPGETTASPPLRTWLDQIWSRAGFWLASEPKSSQTTVTRPPGTPVSDAP